MFQILQYHIPCAAIEDCKGNGKGGSVLSWEKKDGFMIEVTPVAYEWEK